MFLESSQARAICAQIPPFFQRYAFDVLAYCLMPDHLHMLLEGTSPTADFREAMRQWKQQTARSWKMHTGQRLWQAGYHERVLRESDDTRAVVAYLLNNPVRAGLVAAAKEWPWIGSSTYTVADLATHVGDWRPSWK